MGGRLQPLELNVQIPYHFRCPISLELMRDPVTVSTGQTYDRSSIESWVATGNSTCPVTRAPLSDFNVIPNHTLRRLIQQWCVSNKSFGIERIPTPRQPADSATVRSLLNQASSFSISALRKLRALARDSEKNRLVIHNLEGAQILISILFNNLSTEEIKLEAISILSMFHLSESECEFIVSDSNRIDYLVSLLFHTSIDCRVNSAALIEIILSGIQSTELRAQICDTDDVFDGIVGILNYPLAYPRAIKVGIKLLFSLCLIKEYRYKAVRSGCVEALIDKLAEFEKCDAERALATVELLCRIPAGCEAFAGHALTVPLLVKIILKISDRATEYAAGALLSLCSASEECQKEAVGAGVLTQLLMLVQSDCTERAKRKAQMLLKRLRDSWPQDSFASSHDLLCSDILLF